MLDTSMVLAISEFSSGRHWHTNLPMIFAGNFGDAQMGRWLNHLNYPVDEAQESGGYRYLRIQCLASICLHASNAQTFGGSNGIPKTFGYSREFQLESHRGVHSH